MHLISVYLMAILLRRSTQGDPAARQSVTTPADDVRFHLSPVPFDVSPTNGLSPLPAPVTAKDQAAVFEENLQFSVDTSAEVVGPTASIKVSPAPHSPSHSPTRRFVNYQRVCIGGDDTSGVSSLSFFFHVSLLMVYHTSFSRRLLISAGESPRVLFEIHFKQGSEAMEQG